jgi:hypothetical protein
MCQYTHTHICDTAEVDAEELGYLNKERLRELLEACGTDCDSDTVDIMFDLMDVERNGRVTFEVGMYVSAYVIFRECVVKT